MLYVATGARALRRRRARALRRRRGRRLPRVAHVQQRVTIWLHPWTDDRSTARSTASSSYARTAARTSSCKSLYSIANGGFGGTGLGQGTFTTVDGDAAHPVPQHRLHLLGDRAGARARSAPPRSSSSTCSSSRAASAIALLAAGRLLEAARRRADVRLRAADVHHRRRRPARDPADRDHAAVRLLRRLERRRELRPARAAPARLEPRERDGARDERADHPPRVRRARRSSARSSSDDVLADLGGGRASPTARTTRSSASPQFTIERGLIFAADGTRARATNRSAKVGGQTLYFRRYPHGRARRARRRLLDAVARSRTGLERSLNDYLTGSNANLAHGRRHDARRAAAASRSRATTSCTDARPRRRSASRSSALGGNCGAVVALEPRTGKVLVMASSPELRPEPRRGATSARSQRITADCTPAAPLLNRATAGPLRRRARRSRS